MRSSWSSNARGNRGPGNSPAHAIFPTLLALVLIPALCGALPAFRFTSVEIDLHLTFIVFLAACCPGVRGALGAFAVSWLADLFTGAPDGLVLCATMITFVISRLATTSMRDRSFASFVLVCTAMGLIYGLTCRLLARLMDDPSFPTLSTVFLSALALSVASALVYPLLDATDRRAFGKPNRRR